MSTRYYTVREFAKKAKMTIQQVYKELNGFLQPYQKQDSWRPILISEEGLKAVYAWENEKSSKNLKEPQSQAQLEKDKSSNLLTPEQKQKRKTKHEDSNLPNKANLDDEGGNTSPKTRESAIKDNFNENNNRLQKIIYGGCGLCIGLILAKMFSSKKGK